MLRTSRPSNYWGLVQQRGPWQETAIDIQRLQNSKVTKIGGGVDSGGTLHAGHAQWSSSTNPFPDVPTLPPVPNPSTYAQISNLIPGPPQMPPRPGRLPEYVYTDPNQEKQGSFHPTLIFPKDPSESIPAPYDPEYDENMKAFADAKSKRDLITGPFGHDHDIIEHPEVYTEDSHMIPSAWGSNAQAINSHFPLISKREGRTSYTQNNQNNYGPPLSYSQVVTNSITPYETDRSIQLPDGSSITVPSIAEAQLRTKSESASTPDNNDYPPDPDFIVDVHYQIVKLNNIMDNQVRLLKAMPDQEQFSYYTSMFDETIGAIEHFLNLLDIDTSEITNTIRSAKGVPPVQYAYIVSELVRAQFNQVYQRIPPIPTGPEITELNGLPNPEDHPEPGSTTRRLITNKPPLQMISNLNSRGERYTPPSYVVTLPLEGALDGQPASGHQLINNAGAVPTPLEKLALAAGLNPSIWQRPETHITLGDRLAQISGVTTPRNPPH